MKVKAVIPARMASSRYPGKPLCDIHGISMIEHVYRRTKMCESVDETYVATPDEAIRDEVEDFGGRSIMTGTHKRAIDRVAEANKSLNADVVVVVQGDEPLVYPDMIKDAVEAVVENKEVNVSTAVKEIETEDTFNDPNFPKVILDNDKNVIYFSREPIPNCHDRSFNEITAYKHLAVIPFTDSFLEEFTNLQQTQLEQAESIDLIRALEHGYNIRAVEVKRDVYQLDTPEDHEVVNKMMIDDELYDMYAHEDD
jgi:3-deoxy-manno-octulosonate cytidylyltransferase (CMP-KDO synthetase)